MAAGDLSGGWDGIFNYPHGKIAATAFTVTLRDNGGMLAGETTEINQTSARGRTLHALIVGRRLGAEISFVKTYDDHHATTIHYAGTLNADATEISGAWDIPEVWSGTFLMVRRSGKSEAIERKVSEEVAR